MNCKFCNKEINNKGGLVKHENGCSLNPEKISYRSNFIEYNQKVRTGEIQGKNQYITAKEQGKKWVMPKEAIEKNRQKHLGKPLSKEHKEILSFKRSKVIEELGKGGFKHIKWYKIKNIFEEEFIVRGSWELKVAKILNKENIIWRRKIYLKYKDNEGVIRTYTPDFYLVERDLYIEVKGYFSIKDRKKMKNVLRDNNINLIIIDKKIINDEEKILKMINS